MKSGWPVLICLIFSFNLSAQTVKVSYSDLFVLKGDSWKDVQGSTFLFGGHFYCAATDYINRLHLSLTVTLAKIKYSINLLQLDKQMNETKKVTIDTPGHLGPFEPTVVPFAGKIWVFYYQMPETSGIDLLYSVVDPETMAVEPAKKLGTIAESNSWGGKLIRDMEKNSLQISYSPDSSKLLVAQVGNTSDIMTFVFDEHGPMGKPRISHLEEGSPQHTTFIQACLSSAGDRILSFQFFIDRHFQGALLIQNSRGRDKWVSVEQTKDGFLADRLSVRQSAVSGKMYVFGASTDGKVDRGVFLTTLDPEKLRLAPAEVYPYPAELIAKVEKLNYVNRQSKEVAIWRTYYSLSELTNGTIILSGFPVISGSGTTTKSFGMNAGTMQSYSIDNAGPPIFMCIKDGKCAAALIPRSQEHTAASDIVIIPYQDKFVCVYNDNEKNIQMDDSKINKKIWGADQLVLAYAVFGGDGSLIERRKLGDKIDNLLSFTKLQQSLSSTRFLVPLCEYKPYELLGYLHMRRWATVSIE